jgi:ParB family chromosome partitioning protein
MSVPPKSKPRLGRGLSSLISMAELPVEADISNPPAESVSQVSATVTPASQSEISTDLIDPNPHQPRKQFDEAAILSLAASIKSSGLVQPIIVRLAGGALPTGRYELIAGERRLRAAKAAGLATIPVLIREVDSFKQAQMALVENIQREDLNPIDRARAYRALIEQLGLTQAELATRIGEDRSSIANYTRLLDLTEPVQDLVRDGKLSMGHAKILAGVTDPIHQQELAERIAGEGLSVRNLERILEQVQPPATKPPAAEPSAHIRDLERNIASQLGLRVQLRSAAQKGKGRLVIHYASLDQFDQLLERLGCKAE